MGLKEIQAAFEAARAEKRPAFMPYWPVGYPDAPTSLRVIEAIAAGGADMIEIGVPFSDPLADGKVIQHASQVALAGGMTIHKAMDIVRKARAIEVCIPFLVMGYLNPLLAFGMKEYVLAWREAGADGLIVPDLPPEESAELAGYCAEAGLALVSFAAPTSTDDRLKTIAQSATGFVYIVSVAGVTGARDQLPAGLREYVLRVKAAAQNTPVVVGFGISSPEQVNEVGGYADGAIVASALIRDAGEAPDPALAAYNFVKQFRK